uniref:Secreted protein n=1 Tax=Oryza glaberrima TaxID=4538 RepID=I1NRG3_ORYGL
MAAKMVLVRAVSLHTVAMAASACGSDCSPVPRSMPTPSTGSSSSPRDTLKLRVCANVLGLCCSLLLAARRPSPASQPPPATRRLLLLRLAPAASSPAAGRLAQRREE